MERITITIDEDLLEVVDNLMQSARLYQSVRGNSRYD